MTEQDFFIDGWLVEVARGQISRPNEAIHLEPQVMKVLAFLASHHNVVVTKEQLMASLWGHAFVGDAALTRCIFEIRQAFADNSKNPRIVETVPTIGYRLIASLEQPRKQKKSKRVALSMAATFLIGISSVFVWGDQEIGEPLLSQSVLADEAYKNGLSHYKDYTYLHNENAIALFEKAIEHDPEFGLAHASLSIALSEQALRYQGDRVEDARSAADIALELVPLEAPSHNAQGLVAWLLGDSGSSLESFERAYTLDPTHWQSAFNAASIYKTQVDFKNAELLFLQVLEHYPDNITAMEHLGFLYIRMGDIDSATHWLHKVVEFSPMSTYATSQLATLELVSGNTDAAIENCEKVRNYIPNHRACLNVLGVSNLIAGNMADAQAWFEYSEETMPDSRYAKLGQAQILLASGSTAQGLEIIDTILADAMANVPAEAGPWEEYWVIAACYALQGNETEAFHWLDKAAIGGRRFYLWDSTDPVFANLHGDQRFERYIAMTQSN